MSRSIKKPEAAREVYEKFLKRYPDHQMAESARFLLKNMGKSDEEILQTIEANQSNN